MFTFKNYFPKISDVWLKFEYQLLKDPVLELTAKYFSYSEHNSWQTNGIWPRWNFYGQRLMHRLRTTIIYSKILHLKCQFENSAEIYLVLLFTHLNALKKGITPTLGLRLHRNLISITRNADVLHSKGGVMQNGLKELFRNSKYNWFLVYFF